MKEGDYYTCKQCQKTCYYSKNSKKFPYCNKCRIKFNTIEMEEKQNEKNI